MHWHAIEYVVKMQMKALGAITLEDDFYFERWQQQQQKQKMMTQPPPDATRDSEAAGQSPRRGGKASSKSSKKTPASPRSSKKKGSKHTEATSETKHPKTTLQAKCRVWADTQKTLGFSTKSSIKAPRKLLDLGVVRGEDNGSEGNAEGEGNAGESRRRKEASMFNGPFWRCRAHVERGWSLVLKLEEALARSSAACTNASQTHAAATGTLRASLGKLLQLPLTDQPLGTATWPVAAPFLFSEGAQLLAALKGKKLLLRALPLLSDPQQMALLWVAAGNLAHFVFSRESSDDHEVVHASMSTALAASFGGATVPLGVLVQCLRQVTESPPELLLYFLQMPHSALILQALLTNGETKCEAGKRTESVEASGDIAGMMTTNLQDDARAWERALATLQDRVASAS